MVNKIVKIDEQEEKIIRELIKNPRVSDNQISKKTKVPAMTVNRKRKKLEEQELIRYFTSVNTGEEGTGEFIAKELYIIKFRIGLTKKVFLSKVHQDNRVRSFFSNHVEYSFLGEKDGHLALAAILAAKTEAELMEIFNGKLIPFFRENFGEEGVREVMTMNISEPIRMHHNYLPSINMECGKLKEGWSDDWIFTGKQSERYLLKQKNIMQFNSRNTRKNKKNL